MLGLRGEAHGSLRLQNEDIYVRKPLEVTIERHEPHFPGGGECPYVCVAPGLWTDMTVDNPTAQDPGATLRLVPVSDRLVGPPLQIYGPRFGNRERMTVKEGNVGADPDKAEHGLCGERDGCLRFVRPIMACADMMGVFGSTERNPDIDVRKID